MPVLELERLSKEDATRYAGQWVAVKDGKVIFASRDPQEVVRWVTAKRANPDLIFSVPAANDPTDWALNA
jgi:hypothetical protein